MTFIATIVDLVFGFYIFILFARVILDFVRMASPSWTPRGALLVAANWTYSLTDPPLKFLRRFIPPLTFGGMALDVGFLVLFFGVQFARRIIVSLLFSLAI